MPVAIKVLDVNDNAPEFASEYEAFLCENGKPGQVNISMLLMLLCLYTTVSYLIDLPGSVRLHYLPSAKSQARGIHMETEREYFSETLILSAYDQIGSGSGTACCAVNPEPKNYLKISQDMDESRGGIRVMGPEM